MADLSLIPETDWNEAWRRAEVIRPLANREHCPCYMVQAAAATLGLSERQTYTLLRRCRDAGGALTALVPERSSDGRNRPRTAPATEAMLRRVVQEVYLTPQKPTAAEVAREVAGCCRAEKLSAPSSSIVRRRFRSLPLADRRMRGEEHCSMSSKGRGSSASPSSATAAALVTGAGDASSGRDLRHLVNLVHDLDRNWSGGGDKGPAIDRFHPWRVGSSGGELTGRGVGLKVLAGQGANFDTTGANGRLVFGIFATLAEFEREMIVERIQADLASARARGRNGEQPFTMTAVKVRLAQAVMGQRDTKVGELCRELGVSRQTLYRYVNPKGQLRPNGEKLLLGVRKATATRPIGLLQPAPTGAKAAKHA